MNFSLTSRSLLAFGLVLSVPLLTGANGNGCGGGNVVIGNNGGSGTVTCDANACGEAAPAIAAICADGTSVGPTCGVTSDGSCGWTFPCPPGDCTTAECGPLPPTVACPGGNTPSPVCGKNSSGTCGWTVPPCSTTTCTANDCGPEPAIAEICNGVSVGPTCEPNSSGTCGWVFPPCDVPPPDDGGISTCPQPSPQNCNSVAECPCNDGTTQIGGCPNGFTCADACCGHGGSK